MSNNNEKSHPLPEPQKRGRGRPRKPLQEPSSPPAQKRPRGRPKGSTKKGLPEEPIVKVDSTAEKKPRGRPRKWAQQEGPSIHRAEEETQSED